MKKSNKPLFKSFIIDNSSWITNFWYTNEKLFIAESLFDQKQNLLGYLTKDSIENNFTLIKKRELSFLNHPDPMISSALEASLSEIKIIDYPFDYIYQVFSLDEKTYVGFINQDKVHGKTLVYNEQFEIIEEIKDYLILGQINQQLVFLKIANRLPYFKVDQKFIETNLPSLKKVLNFQNYDLILTKDNQLYQTKNGKDLILLYEATDEIQVAKLNEEVILISEKASQQTFAWSLLTLQKTNLIIEEYFFHLEVINNKILVGKRLFLDHRYEDYTLPLTIII